MKIFHGYRNATGLNHPVAAIGIFDGLHIGHRKVLSRLLQASSPGRDSVVITFDPHPKNVLSHEKPLPRIMSLDHRLAIFEKMGIDAVIILHFSDFIANMGPEDFVRNVILGIGADLVLVGENFHFGRGRQGNVDTLANIGRELGIEVRKIAPVTKRGRIVSSTWVRQLVSAGRLQEAEKLLRRPVSVLGTVVSGDRRGAKLGIPTANIDPHQEVIPPPGVYAVKTEISGIIYDGILNIGFKPTFYGKTGHMRKEPSIEVHIFDLSAHLYGLSVEIFFVEKLRNEKKFRTVEELISQIKRDEARSREILDSARIVSKIRKYKYI
jgi:riboflavin kinase/FMN adenylyltransferase